ncbi:hypothetical protein LR48_Vigan05g136700 [Vigna angularis]|uniref:Uncharacterized protein n=2 Tax=Phaseolus angularis TaxID=3914 RepID=A0A0L9UMG4_PHAAN|nr:uncharacterized protein HKW66_Vig0219380 [Vigna angularis]KOM43762.1 hypothetical protein LR48_Vigan05g136700 [Vigna angularis]BAT92333.1 hypothetical protein VIGAN_07103000 [Vigna angularis var. angularis]
METSVSHDQSDKENVPPINTVSEKKKNPIPPMAPSFKRNTKRKMKRVPLADITHLFNNSAQEQIKQIGVAASDSPPPSDSTLLLPTSRRKTVFLLRGSKTLRLGFR